MTIRVLIADDQPLIRQALRLIIDADPGMTVVAEAATGVEAVVRCRATSADVVLMDNHMPDLDGIEASRQITTDPALARIRVLLHTVFVTDDLIATAAPAGVTGFLHKGVDPAILLRSIRDVAGVPVRGHAGDAHHPHAARSTAVAVFPASDGSAGAPEHYYRPASREPPPGA